MQSEFDSGKIQGPPKNIYAVVIFLPQDLDDLIFPLRQKFDPLYNKVPGHITIMFPFESNLMLNELSGIIKHELELIRPIEIELESIGDFYPRSPTIYWEVNECAPIRQLYQNLHNRLDLPVPFENFVPHVTVAREISAHRVLLVKERIVPYLPTEKFTAETIDLIVPLANEKWVSVRSFALSDE
jgi:2'-5' RNA ligase